MPAFYRLTATGAVLRIRVTPNAGADCLDGAESRDDGEVVLRLRVHAVPDKGKANAAVIALLARSLDLSKSAFELEGGATARLKSIAVAGDPARLAPRLDTLAGQSAAPAGAGRSR